MWAMTNRHKGIAKLLLDHGASSEIRSTSGRTAFDFMPPNSELADYLHESGYIGSAGVSDDFYDTGLAQDRFEEEMAENELKRRMMMESAINLEVDLSSLGLDEQQEVSPSPPHLFSPPDIRSQHAGLTLPRTGAGGRGRGRGPGICLGSLPQ